MREKKWAIKARYAPFDEIAKKFGIHKAVARVIVNRGIDGDEAISRYLRGDEKDLYDPALLSGAREAAVLLKKKIDCGARIRVIGDYDVDGVCSVYILLNMLRALGARADHAIPHRIEDGYGLHEPLVKRSFEEGTDTIITCDNGINAMQAVSYAKDLGMTVIITDHHRPDTDEDGNPILPDADVIVDAILPDNTYPFEKICGAVTAWKVMLLMCRMYGDEVLVRKCLDMADVAALATVVDIMPLCDENRTIVKLGLEKIQKDPIPGLKALMREKDLIGKKLSAYHFGFVIGPCINSSGRLESADISLELLMSEDESRAAVLAKKLVGLNEERKRMTEESIDEGIRQAEKDGPGRRVLVIYLPECHQSIAGIVAGKIKEHFYRPVFVITGSADPDVLKGSGRSIEGYDMKNALEESAAFLVESGGHAMAGGLSLLKENYLPFKEHIEDICTLTDDELTETVLIDMELPFRYLSFGLADDLSLLEPCGVGNRGAVFARKNVRITQCRPFGEGGRCLDITFEDDLNDKVHSKLFYDKADELIKYIAGKYGEKAAEGMTGRVPEGIRLDILYTVAVDDYYDPPSLEIRLKDYR